MRIFYPVAAVIIALQGCSESVGDASLTFTGIGKPGLSFDVEPTSLPDGNGQDSISGDTAPFDGGGSDTATDAGPDVEPDVVVACGSDEDCTAVLGQDVCRKAVCGDSGVCEWENASDETSCDDGDLCTTTDSCQAGACIGDALTCESDNPCIVLECQSDIGCVDTGKAEGNACDDSNDCTADDLCAEGVCTGTPVCQCETDEDCADNGNLCDGTPICQNNLCVTDPATVVVCATDNPCTGSTCNPSTGGCEESKLTGPVCDDGDACTSNDSCTDGACGGTPICECQAEAD